MTLLAVREQFVKYSGRYDLVVDPDTWADNGADWYITAGQKWLDSTYMIARSQATYFQDIGVGGWYAIIPSCRVVYKVWLSNITNVRWEVDRKSLRGLRQLYPGSLADVDPGVTRFYAPLHLRDVPEVLDTITVDSLGQTAYTVAGEIYSYNGILFAPPTSEALRIEIEGEFKQPPLIDDADVNWWSEEQPAILVMAACRQLEIAYRNTAGVTDWESSIKSELFGHELDLADSESTGISQMEG